MREYRILLLEDNENDAELIIRQLQNNSNFIFKKVTGRDDYIKELGDFAPDLILADYNLPQFDGLSAIQIAKADYPEVQIIVVSGAIGDERAVELIKEGATDYVLKNNMKRLPLAVNNALKFSEQSRLENEFISCIKTLELEDLEIQAREMRTRKLRQKLEELRTQIKEMCESNICRF